MTKPPSNDPSTTNDTPSVKAQLTYDRPNRKHLKIQLQGLMLNAFEDALKDRGETPKQLITDLLEAYLVKEKYLPDWWFTRGKGIS